MVGSALNMPRLGGLVAKNNLFVQVATSIKQNLKLQWCKFARAYAFRSGAFPGMTSHVDHTRLTASLRWETQTAQSVQDAVPTTCMCLCMKRILPGPPNSSSASLSKLSRTASASEHLTHGWGAWEARGAAVPNFSRFKCE